MNQTLSPESLISDSDIRPDFSNEILTPNSLLDSMREVYYSGLKTFPTDEMKAFAQATFAVQLDSFIGNEMAACASPFLKEVDATEKFMEYLGIRLKSTVNQATTMAQRRIGDVLDKRYLNYIISMSEDDKIEFFKDTVSQILAVADALKSSGRPISPTVLLLSDPLELTAQDIIEHREELIRDGRGIRTPEILSSLRESKRVKLPSSVSIEGSPVSNSAEKTVDSMKKSFRYELGTLLPTGTDAARLDLITERYHRLFISLREQQSFDPFADKEIAIAICRDPKPEELLQMAKAFANDLKKSFLSLVSVKDELIRQVYLKTCRYLLDDKGKYVVPLQRDASRTTYYLNELARRHNNSGSEALKNTQDYVNGIPMRGDNRVTSFLPRPKPKLLSKVVVVD